MQTIGHYETGQAVPSFDMLVKLAEALDVSIDYLMGRDDRPPPPKPSPWLANLLPELEALDKSGREAVKALVKGLKKI